MKHLKVNAVLGSLILMGLLITACSQEYAATEGVRVAQPQATSTGDRIEPSTTAPSTTVTTLPDPTEANDSEPTQAQDLSTLTIRLEEISEEMSQPIGMSHAGDGSGRLFIVERTGAIRIIDNDALLNAPFLDISDRITSARSEQGLLGLAFSPDYPEDGFFFVYYTDGAGNTVVSRFSVSEADPNRADRASEQIVLQQTQPASNHNGGQIAFGPDGMLYIGLGDGGGGGDTYQNGQNLRSWLGAMIRVDVHTLPYRIPSDNPFIGAAIARDEIWAYGLRNPWRFSFDRETGDLYIADVGQNQYEEINIEPAGSGGASNYGWPIMEGLHCFPDTSTCEQSTLVLPIAEYSHADGCSVSGGYVYRGEAHPELEGIYFFGDYCSGFIWGLSQINAAWEVKTFEARVPSLTSFGEDEQGEIYVLSGQGRLYRITQ